MWSSRILYIFALHAGRKFTFWAESGYFYRAWYKYYIQNFRTSQGYIFFILQHLISNQSLQFYSFTYHVFSYRFSWLDTKEDKRARSWCFMVLVWAVRFSPWILLIQILSNIWYNMGKLHSILVHCKTFWLKTLIKWFTPRINIWY